MEWNCLVTLTDYKMRRAGLSAAELLVLFVTGGLRALTASTLVDVCLICLHWFPGLSYELFIHV